MITLPVVRRGVPALIVATLLILLLCAPTTALARLTYHAEDSYEAENAFGDDAFDDDSAFDGGMTTYYSLEELDRLQKQYANYNAKHGLKTFSGLPAACSDHYCTHDINGKLRD